MRLMGVGPKDKDGIARLIDEVNIDIRYEDGVQHMILNGADVTGEIRTPEISMYASGVSAQPCVRAFLLDTSDDTVKQSVDAILTIVRRKLG